MQIILINWKHIIFIIINRSIQELSIKGYDSCQAYSE